jgi:hypothetical protein
MTEPLLICSDLDRTLVPNGDAPESPGARKLFRKLAVHSAVQLAYVSGRDVGRVKAVIDEFNLPMPDHVVTDVGSAIYDTRSGNLWQRNHDWEADIGQEWGDRAAERIAGALSTVSFLKPQEASKQGPLKVSFYFPSELSEPEVQQAVREPLTELDTPVTLIYSIDEPRDIGLLDVVPNRASKLHAVHFLMQMLEIPMDRIVFCGDSGNDLSVLASPLRGVLVANASSSVKHEALRLAAQAGTESQLYVAKGSFMNMNGNYAAGILEGICHFFPETLDWISDRKAQNDRLA